MVHARGLVTALDQRGYRLIILRFSGVLVLGIALWMLWMSLHALAALRAAWSTRRPVNILKLDVQFKVNI